MPFAYYRRLSRRQQAIYRRSDAIVAIPLTGETAALRDFAHDIARALSEDNALRVQAVSRRLIDSIIARLGVASVGVTVLAVRPHNDWGELHGFYRPATETTPSSIVLWMRTAQRKQVVAFRTFLRTLLHELCHHLDYTLFDLRHSFHTQGFYRRESSLMRQLAPAELISTI
jgi:hypothetical protein